VIGVRPARATGEPVGRAIQRPRAARVTALILGAALARALLGPLGEGPATAVFAVLLLAIVVMEGLASASADRAWGVRRSLIGGLAVAILLIAPTVFQATPSRPLGAFLSWAAVTALVATLEEATIRGTLQQAWSGEGGPLVGIAAAAAVFALIHLPRYGLAALPLDFAVGLALGGLRVLSGRVLPCAVAHTVADWAAWFTA
jgi:membrane protease YdiL (CAAX protease family)